MNFNPSNLPPGCTDEDVDPGYQEERERKRREREEALEDKADAERDEESQ